MNETSAATDIATVIVDAQDRLTTAATVEGMEMQMPTHPAGPIVTGSARTDTLAETVGAAIGEWDRERGCYTTRRAPRRR